MFSSMKLLGIATAVATLAAPLLAQTNLTTPGTAVQSDRGREFAMPTRFMKARDLMGMKVTNNADEDLGKIEDIVVDAGSGRILYGVLSFGGFLGVGDKLFAIPWESLQLTGDSKAYVLNVEKDRLKNAEGFDKKHWPNFADEQWATKPYQYYGRSPYWTGVTAQNSNDYHDRWNQRVSIWQKVSSLCGKDVRNAHDEKIGDISNLAIDPDSGRILYGILSHRGKLFAIPWSAFSFSGDAKYAILNVSKDKLSESQGFSNDKWPNLVDPTVAATTHDYYGQQKFWDRG